MKAETTSAINRFISDNFALVVIGVLVVLFGSIALIGGPPPPEPPSVVTLSPASRRALAKEIASAIVTSSSSRDAGDE